MSCADEIPNGFRAVPCVLAQYCETRECENVDRILILQVRCSSSGGICVPTMVSLDVGLRGKGLLDDVPFGIGSGRGGGFNGNPMVFTSSHARVNYERSRH